MIRAVLFALVLAAGCAPTADSETQDEKYGRWLNEAQDQAANPTENSNEDTCGMARFQHLIGTPASEIDRSALPPRTRIITPDSMVTQDYSPGRLNILTGTDGRISSMRCF